MHRAAILSVTVLALGTTTALDAAPPTEDDWFIALGRYAGTFDITTTDGEAGGQYSLEWEEPFTLAHFAFHTTGGPLDSSAGLCFWNTTSSKCEFAMVQEGPEGRLNYDGHLADATASTVTWDCRAWNADGVVRTFTATDTFDADGNIRRTFSNVTGQAFPVTEFDWTRINPFHDHFPGAEDFIGTWNYTQGGQKMVSVVEWGPGRRSIRQADHRVDAEGNTTLQATCSYMYDQEADCLYGHYLNEEGVDVWGNPVVTSKGGVHTVTTEWSGVAKGSRVAATTTSVIDGKGPTVTNTMKAFMLDGSSFPDGAIKQAMEAPVVMTRTTK